MQNNVFAMLNGPEILLIFGVVLILFGAKRLPEMARGLGQGLREFKKASHEIADDLQQELHSPPENRVEQLPALESKPGSETLEREPKCGGAGSSSPDTR